MKRTAATLAAVLLLGACGASLPAPSYSAERPPGSGAWTEIAALPPWVAARPASDDGMLRFVLDAKSNFRGLALGVRSWAERETSRDVETRLAPVVGAEDAARAAAAVPAALRLADRVAKEEVLTNRPVVGNTLATVWSLWEVPLDAVLAPLPAEKRDAARAALR